MRNEQLLRPPYHLALLVGAFGLMVSACGSSSAGSGSSDGDCGDYATFDGTSPTVQFKADVLPIFRQSCGISSSCHGSASPPPPPGQHYLGPAVADAAPDAADIMAIIDGIVGQKSVDEPEMNVVTAGSPQTSFMMYKLDGPNNPESTNPDDTIVDCSTLKCTASMTCLLPMPQGGPQLPAAERDTIRRWIAQGAKND
jgi:hypothetical protein